MVNQRKAGAVLSYASLAVNAVVSFVYVPLLLGFLTKSEYGVYELIGSIIAYLSVMDMGLSTTLSRYYVKTKVSDGRCAIENLLAMAAVVYAVLTVAAIAVAVGVNCALDSLFAASFSGDELELAHQMMVLVIVNCAISLPGNWFLAVVSANERFVFARSLSLAKYVAQVLCVLIVLSWRASALYALAAQVAVNAAYIVVCTLYCKLILRVKSRLYRWDWRLAASLLSFSFFVLLNMVFDQVFWKTGQVVLGAVVGSAAVASYGIACKIITSAYMQLSTGVTSVFLPKITAICARTKDMAEINELFCRIGHIQAILVWGICAAFVVLGREFIWLWAGSDYTEVYYSVVILMLGLSISLVQNMGLLILQAKNKMGFRSVVYIALALLDVVISIPVSAEYGVVGCACVAALLLFVGTGPIINAYYRKVIGIDIRRFFKMVLPVVFPVVLAGLITWALSGLFTGFSWPGLVAKAGIFFVAYVSALWVMGLNQYEKSLLLTGWAQLRARICRQHAEGE